MFGATSKSTKSAPVAFLALVLCLALALLSMFPCLAQAEDVDSASSASSSDNADAANDANNSSDAGSHEKKQANGDTIIEIEGETNAVDPTQRADNSFIYDTTIESLFTQGALYEGRTVQVEGEAIGDIVETPINSKYCWVTMTSTDETNPSTISVMLSTDQAKQIDHLGRYGVTGTILQVRGTFHQACSDHEGIPDIHASNVAAIERGVEHPDLFELNYFIPGIIATSIGLILMGVYYFVRERTR